MPCGLVIVIVSPMVYPLPTEFTATAVTTPLTAVILTFNPEPAPLLDVETPVAVE